MNFCESTKKNQTLLVAAGLALLTLLAYLPALQGGFIWDDDLHITENEHLHNLTGLREIWFKPGATIQYYPLVHTCFWVEYHLWGLWAPGYHFDSVLLQSLNAVLVGLILSRLGVRGAWFAAAIFAVHPVHVESVAWASERKNLLSGAFYLLSLLAFIRFAKLEKRADTDADQASRGTDEGTREWRVYFLALALFVCALLSKTVTCSLPAILLVLCWWKRGRVTLRDFGPLVPVFVIGAALGLTTAWLEKHVVGAGGTDWSFTFLDRFLLAGRALWFYASKLIWPAELIFIYPRWQIDSHIAWQYAFPLAAAGVVLTLWLMRNRIGRGPLTAVLVFALTLFPALGFIDVFPFRYSFVADHFQYLASLGLITLFAACASGLGRLGKLPQVAVSAAIIAVLAMFTWNQGYTYKNLEMLWRDTLEKNNGATIAHFNLANLLAHRGSDEEALVHYSAAIQQKPTFFEAYTNRADTLTHMNRLREAFADYSRGYELAKDRAQKDELRAIEKSLNECKHALEKAAAPKAFQ